MPTITPDTAAAPEAVAATAPVRRRPAPPADPLFASDHHALPAEVIDRLGDDPDFVTALARGLAVLLSLSDKRRRMSIAQVSHLTGIPRAAARRSLHTLAKLGFVAVDDARRFYLRPRVLSFSHAYLSSSPVAGLAQPILDRLGESLHEASSLAMLDGDEIVYLARSTTSRIMSPSLNVGRRLPAYCTSVGLVLLAHLPDEEFDAYLSRARFHPYTEHTPTTVERVRALVNGVHEKGYAYANQLVEPRICTMAVPVRDAGGHYVAGINVIVQGRLMSDAEMADRFLRPLQRAALELGSLLLP
jgi:IclR family transcriptional regulator, pca regulon regulatory protein